LDKGIEDLSHLPDRPSIYIITLITSYNKFNLADYINLSHLWVIRTILVVVEKK